MAVKKRHGGSPIKAALVAGCTGRRCAECRTLVLIPRSSDWTTCTPCQKGWR